MRQIGFKNFRKFKDFPIMNLAPITIFVGENNAGKSTVVKGILALSDFLNESHFDDFDPMFYIDDDDEERYKRDNIKILKNIKFNFNSSYLAHIGTFKRALYNKAENNLITFYTLAGKVYLSITVEGNPEDEESVSGRLTNLKVNISPYNIDMAFNFDSDEALVTFNPRPINQNPKLFQSSRGEILKAYFELINHPITLKTKISNNWRPSGFNIIISFIECIEMAINATFFKELSVAEKESRMPPSLIYAIPFENISEEDLTFLKKSAPLLSPSPQTVTSRVVSGRVRFLSARTISTSMNIEYLYAHAVSQTVIYSAKDTNDYLSRTIHEFAPFHGIRSKHLFVTKWMKEFGIGTDFAIRSVGGEAHIVYITNNDGEKVNLADKGMGSIQLMVLLFRLAITLPSKQDRDDMVSSASSFYGKVIIIEEPEQNLHPKLQSKLADLFFQLNKHYHYHFIIETHSEYLIRKTQVIVSEQFNTEEGLKKNPFKIYYFPSEDVPYEVVYRTNGRFENDFGSGFFDEAANLTFKLF